MSITSDRIREQGFIHTLLDEAADEIEALEAQLANLQAAKPEQAQTAVGLPKLQPHDHPEPRTHKWSKVELEAIEDYATAKTAEAVRELVEGLQQAKHTLDILWLSHHANRTDAAIEKCGELLTKYAPKKEQDNASTLD